MLRRISLALAVTALASVAAPGATSAQSGACQMGATVIDRQERAGVVVEAKGSDCRVRHADGTVHSYLAWTLKPASEAGSKVRPGAGGPLRAGTYLCTAAGGIAGKFRLAIRSETEYAGSSGKTGTYTLNAADGTFVFNSGPWAEYRGAKLGPAKIGLTSRPGGSYNTVCDLQ